MLILNFKISEVEFGDQGRIWFLLSALCCLAQRDFWWSLAVWFSCLHVSKFVLRGVGVITPGIHGKGHGSHHQGRSSPRHQDLRRMALVGVHRKASRRYLEDRDRSVWTLIDIVIQIKYLPHSRLENFPDNHTPPEYIMRDRGALVTMDIGIQIQILSLT